MAVIEYENVPGPCVTTPDSAPVAVSNVRPPGIDEIVYR